MHNLAATVSGLPLRRSDSAALARIIDVNVIVQVDNASEFELALATQKNFVHQKPVLESCILEKHGIVFAEPLLEKVRLELTKEPTVLLQVPCPRLQAHPLTHQVYKHWLMVLLHRSCWGWRRQSLGSFSGGVEWRLALQIDRNFGLACYVCQLACLGVCLFRSFTRGRQKSTEPARICKFNSTKRLATCHQTEKEKDLEFRKETSTSKTASPRRVWQSRANCHPRQKCRRHWPRPRQRSQQTSGHGEQLQRRIRSLSANTLSNLISWNHWKR